MLARLRTRFAEGHESTERDRRLLKINPLGFSLVLNDQGAISVMMQYVQNLFTLFASSATYRYMCSFFAQLTKQITD